MHASKIKLLPSKLNLEMVAAELGLSHLSQSSQLMAILQYQRDRGLILRSDAHIDTNAQLTCYDTDEYEEDDGTVTRLAFVDDVNWITTRGETVTLGAAYLTGDSRLTVATFSLSGAEFYPVDFEEEYVVPVSWEVSSVYVLKEDLFNFQNKTVDEIPTYADPTSEHFAPELALAIKLHTELRVNNGGKQGHGLKSQIYLWLKKNGPNAEPTDAKVNRLTSILGNGKKHPKP